MTERPTSSQGVPRYLPLAVIAAGVCAGMILDRTMESHQRVLRARLVAQRLHIEALTGIRRDMRKAYVELLENANGIGIGDASRQTRSLTSRVNDVMAGTRAYAMQSPTFPEENVRAAAVMETFASWEKATRAAIAVSGPAPLENARAQVREIDRTVGLLLDGLSKSARENDSIAEASKRRQEGTRLITLAVLLALIGGNWVWRVRSSAKRRIDSAERARAEQEKLNATLELAVAERTQALANSIAKLRESQAQLVQAGKLAAVGQMAAGVAHEINTPVQFVGDSVLFIRDAINDLTTLLETYRSHLQSENGASVPHLIRAEDAADLPYLLENLPKAIDSTLEGLNRVATIVRSMKEFAHPDQKEMTEIDLNRALESTLVIARNEYKFVADVKTELGTLPLVTCYAGELNQVFLNILVNAAHAVGDVVKGTQQRGTITVRTQHDGGWVVVSIADTGAGIPREVWDRIYDPFFTTKEVGKGTGQGLAIARSVVVDKHGGELRFETEAGKGTTFFIRVPVSVSARAAAGEVPLAATA